MRVDLGNLTEITKKSAAVQNKGTQAVLNENITTKETDKTGHSYTVKSVTYETLLAEDKKSAEDIAMQADAVDPQAMHDEMAVLANTTTEEDYEKMEEDGYSVNDTEIPEIVTEMDKIEDPACKSGRGHPYFRRRCERRENRRSLRKCRSRTDRSGTAYGRSSGNGAERQ